MGGGEPAPSRLKLLVPTLAAAARVIGVSEPAVRKAWNRGKFGPEADGTWDVLGVVEGWRSNSYRRMQPDHAAQGRPWLDAAVPLDSWDHDAMGQLIARARCEGATVLENDVDGSFAEVPPLGVALRSGKPLGCVTLAELTVIPDAWAPWWRSRVPCWATVVAKRLGLEAREAEVRRALFDVMHDALVELAEREDTE